jgi:hypothetical protein
MVTKFRQSDSYDSHLVLGDKVGGEGGTKWQMTEYGWLVTPPTNRCIHESTKDNRTIVTETRLLS